MRRRRWMLCFKHKILSRNGLLGRPATDNRWIENDLAFRPNNESVHLTRLELTKTFFESDHFGRLSISPSPQKIPRFKRFSLRCF